MSKIRCSRDKTKYHVDIVVLPIILNIIQYFLFFINSGNLECQCKLNTDAGGSVGTSECSKFVLVSINQIDDFNGSLNFIKEI